MNVAALDIVEGLSVGWHSTVREAAEYMTAAGLPAVAVHSDGGSILGVVTAEICAQEVANADARIGRLLDAPLVTVDLAAPIERAWELMREHHRDWLVVQECGLFTGLIDRDRVSAHLSSGVQGVHPSARGKRQPLPTGSTA